MAINYSIHERDSLVQGCDLELTCVFVCVASSTVKETTQCPYFNCPKHQLIYVQAEVVYDDRKGIFCVVINECGYTR